MENETVMGIAGIIRRTKRKIRLCEWGGENCVQRRLVKRERLQTKGAGVKIVNQSEPPTAPMANAARFFSATDNGDFLGINGLAVTHRWRWKKVIGAVVQKKSCNL
jgi:hypothetical protein